MLLALSLVPAFKQEFNKLLNGTSQRNKHQKFDSKLLKKDKKSYKDTDFYYNGYIAIKELVIMRIFIVQVLSI